MTRILFLFTLLFSCSASQLLTAQSLVANAGVDALICPGQTAVLGGTPAATGGQPPYTYAWIANPINLSSNSVANPIAQPATPHWYVLQVTDDTGAVAYDTVHVDLYPVYAYNAGANQSICLGQSATLGAAANDFTGGVNYSWTPVSTLNNPNDPRPIATPTATTVYSVVITSPNCPTKNYQVTVTVNPKPVVVASGDATINEGETTIISATGASQYVWQPSQFTSNPYLASTNAEPPVTTVYTVYGVDANGCTDEDTVRIIVIPSSEVVLYNTFSPNGDYVNDIWFIGNIAKYPNNRLEVYDRTGQLVFAKTGYDNSWDGTNYGDKLPAGVYYFTLDLGDGSEIIRSSVTIIR